MKQLVLLAVLGAVLVYVAIPIWRDWQVQGHFKAGVADFCAERWPEAARRFERVTEVTPDCAEAWYNLGLTRERMGQFEEAARALERALCNTPGNPEYFRVLGQVRLKCGQHAAAREALASALRSQPNNAEAYNALGQSYHASGDFIQAIESYQQAIRNKLQNEHIHYNLAVCLAQLARYEEAINQLQEAIRRTPSDPSAHALLGRIFLKMGNRAGAKRELEIVRKLDSQAAEELQREIDQTEEIETRLRAEVFPHLCPWWSKRLGGV